MKLKYIFLFLILTTPIYSQRSIGISGGTDLFSNNLSNKRDYLGSYWHNGININVNGEYFISNKVSLNGTFEYGYYRFDHYSFDEIHFPETSLVTANGKDSKAIRVFGNIRSYTDSSKMFQAFITTGLGYISEDIGTITATFNDLNFGQSTTELKYEGRHNFVHILGIGARIKFLQDLAIDVSGSYYSDYTNFINEKMEISFVYLFNNNKG
jgi:hypothetical protein